MRDIKSYLSEAIKNDLKSLERFESFEGHRMELLDVSPGGLEFVLRAVRTDGVGAPRYFRVKLSEML
jgi:hypothetical protein